MVGDDDVAAADDGGDADGIGKVLRGITVADDNNDGHVIGLRLRGVMVGDDAVVAADDGGDTDGIGEVLCGITVADDDVTAADDDNADDGRSDLGNNNDGHVIRLGIRNIMYIYIRMSREG